jgi:hypothetical protein
VPVTVKSGVFCVVWRDPSVLEEHIASIFRVIEQAKQETSRSWQIEQTAQETWPDIGHSKSEENC